MPDVSIVPVEVLGLFWDRVEPHLKKAADRSLGRYQVEDIHDLLTQYDYQLFIAYEGIEVIGTIVVHPVIYPRKIILCVDFMAGDNPVEAWGIPLFDLLLLYAKELGYDGLEAQGRSGWSKKLLDNGYKYKKIADAFEIAVE